MSNKNLTAIILTLVMIIANINFVSAAEYEYDALCRLVKVTYTNSTDGSKSA